MVFKYDSADLSRVTDRAGVRVVVHVPDDVESVCAIIRRLLPHHEEENVAGRYGPDTFGYRGIHFDVTLDGAATTVPLTGEPTCEIQVRSAAEHAWSVLSHLLTYKSPGEEAVPAAMRRRINRLIALVELFDQEARATRADIMALPEYGVQRLIYDLDRVHAATVGDLLPTLYRCDSGLVAELAGSYRAGDDPSALVRAFADLNRDRIRNVVQTYDSHTSVLVRQPESFLLWERLDADPVDLAQRWVRTSFPQEILRTIATVWGVDLPEV
jgi:hypothetical protein